MKRHSMVWAVGGISLIILLSFVSCPSPTSSTPAQTTTQSYSGSRFLTAAGAPTVAGSNGDLYLDTVADEIYVYTDSAWVPIANLKGPSGANGANGANGTGWITGTGSPTAFTSGPVGTMYLDTSTGNVFQMGNSGWPAIPLLNLYGRPGTNGAKTVQRD